MEAHQKLAAVAPDNTEPKNEAMPSRIIYRKESFIADSRVNEFSINTKSHRFQKVVTGHAVLQQPLCPAPMYMEYTTMAIQTLRGGIEISNIAFEDLQFVSPLGLNSQREVSLRLEESQSGQSWQIRGQLSISKVSRRVLNPLHFYHHVTSKRISPDLWTVRGWQYRPIV
jgi:hypothetical protein